MADRKTLCLADGSEESRSAIMFAAHRTANTQAGLKILRVIEPMDPGLWASMGEKMRDALRIEAQEDVQALAQLAQSATGVAPEVLILEGDLAATIARAVDEDGLIKTIVLAAGSDSTGPLLSAAMRGSYRIGSRNIALMVVPGDLSDDEAKELAL